MHRVVFGLIFFIIFVIKKKGDKGSAKLVISFF